MAETRLNRRQFMLLTLQLLALASMPGCRRTTLPVLGTAPVGDLFVAEDHSRFLLHWAEQGIRDAVLVNIDTHDDFHFAPEENISQLKDMYNRKEWLRLSEADASKSGINGLYGIGNWIYAGIRLGVFREVYWVIPYGFLKRSDALQVLQAYLDSIEFAAEDVKTFSRSGNQFRGTIRGMKVTICSLEALPVINEPVLMSVDVDFFPTYVDEYKVAYLAALNAAFTALHARKYRLLGIAACYSINGEYLLPHHRWVGDAARLILKKPDLIHSTVPDLLDMQQQVENEYRSRDAARMLALLRGYPAARSEPSLLLYAALAHMLAGDVDSAYAAAMESCRVDLLYAAALPYIGALYYAKGQYLVAERFFRAGYERNPELRNGRFHFGNCLVNTGKLREALQVYQQDVRLNGSFPTHFMMVDTYVKLGEIQPALETLQLAIGGMQPYSNTRVVSRVVADAIYASLDLAESSGQESLAGMLRSKRSIQRMMKDFPRQ